MDERIIKGDEGLDRLRRKYNDPALSPDMNIALDAVAARDSEIERLKALVERYAFKYEASQLKHAAALDRESALRKHRGEAWAEIERMNRALGAAPFLGEELAALGTPQRIMEERTKMKQENRRLEAENAELKKRLEPSGDFAAKLDRLVRVVDASGSLRGTGGMWEDVCDHEAALRSQNERMERALDIARFGLDYIRQSVADRETLIQVAAQYLDKTDAILNETEDPGK